MGCRRAQLAALSAQCRQQGVLSRGRGLGGDGSRPGLQEYRARRQSSAAAQAGSPQNRWEVRVIVSNPKPWTLTTGLGGLLGSPRPCPRAPHCFFDVLFHNLGSAPRLGGCLGVGWRKTAKQRHLGWGERNRPTGKQLGKAGQLRPGIPNNAM